jgi:hypothetical protein
MFFFREKYADGPRTQPDVFIRLLAVLYIALCADLYLLAINSIMLYKLSINFSKNEYLLIAQLATIVMMFILVSVYQKLAHITIPSFTTQVIPIRWTKFYDLTRFIVSVFVVILLAAYIANLGLTVKSQSPIDTLPGLLAGKLTFTKLGAFLAGLMVASFAFRPSPNRSYPRNPGSIRLLVFVICGISLGLIYQRLDTTATYIAVSTVSFVLTLLGTPLQRSIS